MWIIHPPQPAHVGLRLISLLRRIIERSYVRNLLEVIGHCEDINCNSIEHLTRIEEYTTNVLEAIESAGKECLPRSGMCSKRGKAKQKLTGWSEYVSPFAEESKFWYSIWISAGRPMDGNIFINMRHSKRQFKYAVRRLKRCQNILQNERLVKSLLQGNGNIFEEIKKHRSKPSSFSTSIDGVVGSVNIANCFSEIYGRLYNKVENDEHFSRISDKVTKYLENSSTLTLSLVTDEVVGKAISMMKPNKSDSVYDASSDMYLNGPPELTTHMTNLIRLFLVHGFVPQIVLLCTLLPLVKDGLGDITKSDNYRAIAGGCLVLKIVDLVVLILEGDKLDFDCLQFAYQSKSSTAMCTWTATAVIDHFSRRGGQIYSAAMDMSKAFDLVKWSKLFEILLKRKVDPIFLRLLMYIYYNQQCTVKWSGAQSSWFNVKNGVRQGGITSGIFFAVYIDELLTILR